jgi:hypothetical protein
MPQKKKTVSHTKSQVTKARKRTQDRVKDRYEFMSENKDGWKTFAANEALELKITEEHVKVALCGHKELCVVAQALRDHFTGFVTDFQVGTNVVNLISVPTKTILRFSTSGALAQSIRVWDATKQWKLPPGVYRLLRLSNTYRKSAQNNRWHKKKKDGKGKKSVSTCIRGQMGPMRTGSVCSFTKKVA